jgi:NADPH:quinone reductase-like Zn-dependent oxidoreductase
MSALPKTNAAWQLKKAGTGIDALNFVPETPVPTAERGQLLVRIRAVSLNYRDLLVTRGLYPAPIPDNQVPVSDGAGEVVAVGPDVTDFKAGDRVAAIFTPKWIAGDTRSGISQSGSLGGDLRGVLQQYIAIDSTAVVRLPAHLSFEEGASLPCAAVTAYNALLHGYKPLRADHSVLVMGTGGVSVFAAQIARASGARVFATSSSDEKLQKLVDLGLVQKGDTVNYKKVQDWGKEVKKLNGGHGVDHVVEIGGQGTIHQAIEAIGTDGEISVIGLVAGIHPDKGIVSDRHLSYWQSVRGCC